jgi:hypothetical protein
MSSLKKTDKRFVIIADEFDKVYQHKSDVGKSIINQFQAIGI